MLPTFNRFRGRPALCCRPGCRCSLACSPHGNCCAVPLVDTQSHQTLRDPFRDDELTEQAHRDVAAVGGRLELFDYPGDGHLFTDPTRPDEYDAKATELLWSRVLPFVRVCESHVS